MATQAAGCVSPQAGPSEHLWSPFQVAVLIAIVEVWRTVIGHGYDWTMDSGQWTMIVAYTCLKGIISSFFLPCFPA